MKYQNNNLTYSPSDLIKFIKSPFSSWMDRCYLEDRDSLVPDEDDPMLRVLARRGIEHEAGYLETLTSRGLVVCTIDSESNAAFDDTRKAIEEGKDVIFQARLEGNGFAGFADFLIKEKTSDGKEQYAVWDTKLARHPKPYFIIQLCCYAEMLELMTGARPETIGVVLGTGERHPFRTNDFFFYYQRIWKAFLALMSAWPGAGQPIPDASADHGRWASHAKKWLLDRDHPSQVANISRGQIARLAKVGVSTMAQLAESCPEHVAGINGEVLARLRRQAQLQVQSASLPRPLYNTLPPPADNPSLGLAALPPASKLDIYFDMEGYPAADDWLEYLFGVTYEEDGDAEPHFIDWWAHDAVQEKQAFEGFVDWAYARWLADPAMHIYHYAAYETEALKRLMGRYGTREAEIDTLLRANVFVDLYAVVRRGLLVGEPSYSLKNLEHLYMDRRAGDVTDAGASIVYYDAWCESNEPEDWRESPLLRSIRNYNKDDCDSTFMLAKWLRERQSEAGLSYVAEPVAPEKFINESKLKEDALERQKLAEELLASIPANSEAAPDRLERNRITALLAWLLEFHRRCDKPMWWRLFDRQEMSLEELWDDMDCLSGLQLTGMGPLTNQSMGFGYRFDPEQDTKLAEGSSIRFSPALKLGATIYEFDPEGSLTLKVSHAMLRKAGLEQLPAQTSIIPYEFMSPGEIVTSIFKVVSHYALTGSLAPCLKDFLERNRPRLEPKSSGPLVVPGEDIVEAGIRIASTMQETCLCIQGPPGTGKTYTAARIIHALLKQGKKVGISSNSHKAINNLIGAVCEAGPYDQIFKIGGRADDPLFRNPNVGHYIEASHLAETYQTGLIGGTAWFFSRGAMAGKLDYLFVDEAGQVSIANLVAMSRSTRNIVLMGDQMQLGQPTQGSHPGESGQSILEYYLQGHATIPEDLGIFLPTSWRMHPQVCSFISDAVYESRLKPEAHTANRIICLPPSEGNLVKQEAGVLFVPVEHEGNSQGSDEEVEVIKTIVQDLVGRTIMNEKGEPAGVVNVLDSILFVTPYNMQVRKLKRALPEGSRVASVDKFQGQEAPIVIVSMCASPGEFGSRGMQFVLDKNRLNVAISRAQSLAIVVGDPRLAESPCNSIEDMRRLNLYCWIQSLH